MPNYNLPPNRDFGLIFAILFALLSSYGAYHGANAYVIYGGLLASIAMGLVAFIVPSLLTPLNRVWMKLGELMGKVVSPLVLGIMFFVLITPIAIVTRLFGRDELRLKPTNAHSYWINRTPPGPAGDSFKNQF